MFVFGLFKCYHSCVVDTSDSDVSFDNLAWNVMDHKMIIDISIKDSLHSMDNMVHCNGSTDILNLLTMFAIFCH